MNRGELKNSRRVLAPYLFSLLSAPMSTVLLQFVNITIECVGVTVEVQESSSKSLSESENNYEKVW